MTVRKKSQSKTRMQEKTSYRARYVELAHQGFPFEDGSNRGRDSLRTVADLTVRAQRVVSETGSRTSGSGPRCAATFNFYNVLPRVPVKVRLAEMALRSSGVFSYLAG